MWFKIIYELNIDKTTMKTLFSFIFTTFIIFSAQAQDEISAQKIIDAINQKQAVQYDGLTVVGDLDLTELSNKKSNTRNGMNDEYKSIVETPVVFRNCTFRGDVIAYKNTRESQGKKILGINIDGLSGATYSADFQENVVFEDCKFDQSSEFKYSKFDKVVNFGGSVFSKYANFKYAKFNSESSFSNAIFNASADFKYAKFRDKSSFENIKYNKNADYKYAEFKRPVSFNNSKFRSYADFKYADFASGSTLNNTDFGSDADFKYSNGKRFK